MLTSFQRLLNDPLLTRLELLQPLWSGYGEIARFAHPKLKTSVIIKSVKPPQKVEHPRGWHSDVGHARKLASYQIEAHFYQHFAQRCDEHCYVPRFIAYDITFAPKVGDETIKECQEPSLIKPLTPSYQSQTLVMEDLQASGYNDDKSELTLHDIKGVIRWLAYFHGRFMGEDSTQLWRVGTYWHLATRQDEYKAMAAGALKQSAQAIDSILNNAHYKTLVHGDAKLANFCFAGFKWPSPEEGKGVAAVDFQYVGSGVGVKDLAYFLGSCLSDEDLNTLHSHLCDLYFSHLQEALVYYDKNINFSALETEWRQLYAFACADFHRFLQGWSPEHQKINTYLQSQTDMALAALNPV